MKQILQNMRSGETSVVAAPAPRVTDGHLLIATRRSLISAGTERMLVDFGRASLLEKVRSQPERVAAVLNKVKSDGLLTTLEAVNSKLDEPIPLGYCNVGTVVELGKGVDDVRVGDRIASNGYHADLVRVPKNLCARIPDNVSDDDASFTVVASIALQGIRLANPTLGESFVVMGAGLIGLLAVQLLRAQGCRVLAMDFNPAKLELARQFGAETYQLGDGQDPVSAGKTFSRGRGVDGVLVCASTKSSDPMSQAARMSRTRGRIVLVGVTGLELNRADFYEKELSFQVSCSYGPGRYDKDYELAGRDYPFGFVRWTEQRNFEAVLDLMAMGTISIAPLLTHRFAFENAPEAYQALTSDATALGILLEYPVDSTDRRLDTVTLNPAAAPRAGAPVMGVIGAGNYASRVLIPAFAKTDAVLHTIATTGGTNGAVSGRKAGFASATSDVSAMISNPDINCVVIATRHDSHARLAHDALAAGKSVFVEKPLAITTEQLSLVRDSYTAARSAGRPVQLMVGFNRRYAPHVIQLKAALDQVQGPKSFLMTINAGAIPAAHWTQNESEGGGRIIGEACHFIDLMRHLAGHPIASVAAAGMVNSPDGINHDKACITLTFRDGSFGTIMYLANGDKSFPKERIEVFASGRIGVIDNFRTLNTYGWPSLKSTRLWRQDKGQQGCTQAFLQSMKTDVPTIPPEQIFEVAEITIEAHRQLQQGKPA